MRQVDGQPALLEAELIGAALRYTAVADWFESLPATRASQNGEAEAMDAFNRVEDELRNAGRRLLRRHGHRELVLQQALNGMATR